MLGMLLDRIHERGDRPPHGRVRSSGARFDGWAHASGLARTTSDTASARGPLRPRGARSEVGNEWVLTTAERACRRRVATARCIVALEPDHQPDGAAGCPHTPALRGAGVRYFTLDSDLAGDAPGGTGWPSSRAVSVFAAARAVPPCRRLRRRSRHMSFVWRPWMCPTFRVAQQGSQRLPPRR
jgi:hypothetical protein